MSARLAAGRLDVARAVREGLQGPLHAREVDAPEGASCGSLIGSCIVSHQAGNGQRHLDAPPAVGPLQGLVDPAVELHGRDKWRLHVKAGRFVHAAGTFASTIAVRPVEH